MKCSKPLGELKTVPPDNLVVRGFLPSANRSFAPFGTSNSPHSHVRVGTPSFGFQFFRSVALTQFLDLLPYICGANELWIFVSSVSPTPFMFMGPLPPSDKKF